MLNKKKSKLLCYKICCSLKKSIYKRRISPLISLWLWFLPRNFIYAYTTHTHKTVSNCGVSFWAIAKTPFFQTGARASASACYTHTHVHRHTYIENMQKGRPGIKRSALASLWSIRERSIVIYCREISPLHSTTPLLLCKRSSFFLFFYLLFLYSLSSFTLILTNLDSNCAGRAWNGLNAPIKFSRKLLQQFYFIFFIFSRIKFIVFN